MSSLPTLPRERLPLSLLLAYGAPSIPGAAMLVPIFVHMPKFYSDVVLVPMGYLAIAIAVARVLDALSDPFFGWLSDRTRTRFGRRRPYVALLSPVSAVAFVALFTPPLWLTADGAAVWFGVTFVLHSVFRMGYVLPYWAWGSELTLDYHDRSRLFSVREGCGILGTIVAAVAPGLLIGSWGFTERGALSAMSLALAVLLVAFCILLVACVRERPDFTARASNPFVPGVRRAWRNRPFRILLLTYVVSGATSAIPGTLMPFFNAYVLRPANHAEWLAILLGAYFVAGFLCLPFWVWAARRYGKRPAWLASFVVGMTGGAAMLFLGEGDMLAAVGLIAWAGSSFGAALFLGPAMQADVIDYDELHTGKRREAQYSAFWSVLPKFVAIPSAAVPIAVLGSIGYVPNAEQTPQVVFAIKAIFALAPAISALLAFVVAWRFPIDEAVHRAILAGIDRHAEGAPAVDPLSGRTIPPIARRAVDDDTSWFLDHFSSRELRRFTARGPASIGHDVRRAAILALLACAGSAWVAATWVTNLAIDPGLVAVLAVVASGFAFAVFVFHLLRLGPARALAGGAVALEVVRTHLDPEYGPGVANVTAPKVAAGSRP